MAEVGTINAAAPPADQENPCAGLPAGRLRSICDGTSGLPEEKRQAYLRHWAEKGRLGADALNTLGVKPGRPAPPREDNAGGNPYGPTERDRPCVWRWAETGRRECDVCGSRGIVKAIYFCPVVAGECFEGLGGFRAPAVITPCRQCDLYEPREE